MECVLDLVIFLLVLGIYEGMNDCLDFIFLK